MSNCKIFRNNDGSINKVFDELGNESQLYQDTLFHVSTLVDNIPMTPPVKHYLDKGDIMDTSIPEIALGLWSYSYSNHFRDKYNITKSSLEEVSVDDIIRHINEYYPKPLVQETTTVEQPVIKKGVEELFNANSELANQVYEALEYSYTGEYSPAFLYESGIQTPDTKDYLTYSVVENKSGRKYINTLNKGKKSTDKGIGKNAYYKFIIENQGKNITTDVELSVAGRKVLEQLEKEGYVNKTDAKIVQTKESGAGYTLDVYDKPLYEFTDKIPNTYLIPQQKQQALQLYSQYLDTVFPDSKVKDVVYHFTTEKGKEGILNDNKFKINKPQEEDISFTKNEQWKDNYRSEKVSVLLNIKNPTTRNDRYGMKEQRLENPEIDGGDIKTSDTHRALVVFEPEQIHILGSNNDIEGFKEFVGSNVIPKTLTYNPKTKSKTELLEEFNKLIEVSEKMGTKYPTDAINKIKSFLQDLNFNLSTVDEVLAKRGLKDKPKAVIDFAENLIAFGDGATVEDFAEEIGHIISLHAPQDKNLDRALEAIKGTQLYKDNYLNYVKTYSKPGLALEMSPERKAALEVLGKFYGKLLTGTLTEKDMKISKQPFFTRIMNFVRGMINKTDNFNLRTYLERNRENFFLEPGKEIKSKEIFYSLEESENITYNKMFSAIQRMTDTLKSKMSREIKDTSAPLGEYSKRIANLKTQLGLVYQMKENLAYDSAVADFLKSLYVDSTNVFSFLEQFFVVTKEQKAIQLKDVKFNTQDKIIVGSTVIENNQTAVIFDDIKILKLKDNVDLSTLHYSQLSELREFLVHYNSFIDELGIDNLDNKLENIDKLQDLNALFKYAKDSLNSIEAAVNLLNRKKMPDAIDELIEETGADVPDDIVAALKDTTIKGDLGMMEYLMGTTRDSSQPILRLLNATVKNIMHIAKRNTLSFAGKFLDKLNHRIGQSMDWAYEKYNGKFTGYLISEYNYGWFKEEKEKFFKAINDKYKYPQDAHARTKEINNIVTRHNNMFVTENEISELSMKIFNEGSTPELIERIEGLNKKLEQIEADYNTVLEYRNEISEWYKDNTTSIDNVDEIIQSVINDPELTSSEKNVWYTNNVLLNDDGDVLAYVNELSQPSGKYLNPDYNRLSSTDLEDLNYIKKTKEELDKFLPTKLNKLAPQTYQSTIDTFMKTQLPELKERLKFLGKSTVTKQEDDDFGELTGDKISYEDETRIIKYNPTRYTRQLREPNNISTDLLSSMIAYAKMVSEFKEKAERIEQIEFIAQNIKSGLTVNTDTNITSSTNTSNLIKQLENYLRVQIMGMSYPDITITGTNINLTKLLKNFARFTSSKNLGLNFVTQAVDGITSTIWYNVEKVMGDTVTKKSSALGYKVFKELVQDSIKETSSTIKNNKLSAILRTLGLSDNLHSIFNDLDKNILMRDAGNKALYAGYRASNFFISGNAALSGMHNFRLYNGKWYTEREFSKIQNPTEQFDSLPSAYDNMRVENGLMIIDNMDTKTLNLFTRRMNNLISKIDGKLSAEDKTYAHSTLIGIVTLIHRDWILDGISRRLKKRGFNFDTNAVDEGYWRTTGRFMSNFFANKEKVRNLKFLVENYNALDDVEKEGVRRTMYEMMVAVGFIALAILLNLGDDDDDRPLDYLRDMAAYLATRTTVELTAFYNPFEYIYAATDVFVIGRDLKRIISFTEMFDAREIESGKWEGWTRSQKYFLQNIPGVNGTLSVANPEASNRFIINNVLGFAGGLNKLKYYDLPLIGSMTEQELQEIERDKK